MSLEEWGLRTKSAQGREHLTLNLGECGKASFLKGVAFVWPWMIRTECHHTEKEMDSICKGKRRQGAPVWPRWWDTRVYSSPRVKMLPSTQRHLDLAFKAWGTIKGRWGKWLLWWLWRGWIGRWKQQGLVRCGSGGWKRQNRNLLWPFSSYCDFSRVFLFAGISINLR